MVFDKPASESTVSPEVFAATLASNPASVFTEFTPAVYGEVTATGVDTVVATASPTAGEERGKGRWLF